MNERVAVVTGASGGIGAATVALFRTEGWSVIGVDRRPLTEAVAVGVRADVASTADLPRIVREVRRAATRVDALVNNAAQQLVRSLRETSAEDWDRVLGANTRAAALLAAGLYALLHEARGSIVNVASIHALATAPGMGSYAASKAALVSLTRSMALEFAADGIRVNAVVPGAIDTPMLMAGLQARTAAAGSAEPSPMAALIARLPLGRLGRPNDVAQAIYFLADPIRSSFVTGQTLVVDGGVMARLGSE